MDNIQEAYEEFLQESKQPKDVLSIWDGGEDSGLDRFTVVLDPKEGWDLERGGSHQMIGFADGGRGISQFTSGKVGKHLGKKIKWNELSKESQSHIIGRLKD
jgi:hypothetical protein